MRRPYYITFVLTVVKKMLMDFCFWEEPDINVAHGKFFVNIIEAVNRGERKERTKNSGEGVEIQGVIQANRRKIQVQEVNPGDAKVQV